MFGELPKSLVVGKIKFGEWIDAAIRILVMSKILDGFSLVNYRRFTTSPSFPAAKYSCYMVLAHIVEF